MVTNSNPFITRIYPKLLITGNKVCHQLDDRSYHFGVRKFPVCARCTGIYIGQLLGIVLYFAYIPSLKPSLYLCLALAIPMIVDGITQLRSKYESTNNRRLITGLLFGYAIVTIAIYCINEIANKF